MAKLENNRNKLIFNKKWELYLYIPLMKFKGIKIIKKTDKKNKIVNINKLSIKYGQFMYAMKAQDNLNDKEVNDFQLKQNTTIENNYLNLVEDKNK